MQNDYEMLLKKVNELERRLERYYQLLLIRDELDFILKGKYICETDLDEIFNGTYTLNN